MSDRLTLDELAEMEKSNQTFVVTLAGEGASPLPSAWEWRDMSAPGQVRLLVTQADVTRLIDEIRLLHAVLARLDAVCLAWRTLTDEVLQLVDASAPLHYDRARNWEEQRRKLRDRQASLIGGGRAER